MRPGRVPDGAFLLGSPGGRRQKGSRLCPVMPGESGSGLDYQLEYVIGGQASDAENLEETVRRLLLVRMASNFAHPD